MMNLKLLSVRARTREREKRLYNMHKDKKSSIDKDKQTEERVSVCVIERGRKRRKYTKRLIRI